MTTIECIAFDSEVNNSFCVTLHGDTIMDAVDNYVMFSRFCSNYKKVRHTHDNVVQFTDVLNNVSYVVFALDRAMYDDVTWGVNTHATCEFPEAYVDAYIKSHVDYLWSLVGSITACYSPLLSPSIVPTTSKIVPTMDDNSTDYNAVI